MQCWNGTDLKWSPCELLGVELSGARSIDGNHRNHSQDRHTDTPGRRGSAEACAVGETRGRGREGGQGAEC